jgi:hypothetical protein
MLFLASMYVVMFQLRHRAATKTSVRTAAIRGIRMRTHRGSAGEDSEEPQRPWRPPAHQTRYGSFYLRMGAVGELQ